MGLDENDFLTFYLYTASKSPQIRQRRMLGWVFGAGLFLFFAYMFFEHPSRRSITIYFWVVSAIGLFAYPFSFKRSYERRYRKYVKEKFKARFGEDGAVEFIDDSIVIKEKAGDVKINKSELSAVNEIMDYYFITSKTGTAIIISKIKTGQQEMEQIKKGIKSLIQKNNVKHNIELNWRWR